MSAGGRGGAPASAGAAGDAGAGRGEGGFVNAHTHLYSGLAPFGMPQPAPAPRDFVEILEKVWWRLDRALDEAALRASARWYVAQALALGTAGLIDHHESPNLIEGSLDVLADACEEAGLPAVLCYGATERNGGRDEARRGLAECRRFIETNTRRFVRGVVGVHASFTVSDDTLRDVAALCRELGTVAHVHVAEDRADVDDARRRGWDGPLERLADLGAIPPGSILAHGVHLSPAQVERAGALGCWLVQNPRSNRGNRVGYPAALRASERVALGTDGYPSEMPAEVRAQREDAPAHGDDPQAGERRLARGRALLAERFEGAVPPAGSIAPEVVDARRAQALAQAPRLWARMRAV